VQRTEHWNRIFETKPDEALSWFEADPAVSLAMLDAAGITNDSCVIDVGGGESRLVDRLIERGFTCLAVLDVSVTAIERAKARLAAAASVPTWIVADVTGGWSVKPMDVWHDRALFHFLTSADDRARYVAHLKATLKPGGAAILATFALDGPEKCSGLPVARYSPESLAAELGPDFRLEQQQPYVHRTPWGATQSFQYSRFTHVR
jgi:SAM-dependent methyltransferase